MAKEKWEKFTQINVCGTLDVDENGERIVIVDGETYLFESLIEELLGHQVEIKCSK